MIRLTRGAFQKLVDDDIAWLEQQPRTLERDHTIECMKAHVELTYCHYAARIAEQEEGISLMASAIQKAREERAEWKARAEKAETELREVLSVLEGGGPATETLFALAQRGTAKKIRALLGLTLAPEVGS